MNGRVIMYADRVTDSMKRATQETARRRKIQAEFNRVNHIQPETIKKEIREGIEKWKRAEEFVFEIVGEDEKAHELKSRLSYLYSRMERASSALDFERAAKLRDEIRQLEKEHGLGKKSLLKSKPR